jgi:autotransporter-associated beta strand protein
VTFNNSSGSTVVWGSATFNPSVLVLNNASASANRLNFNNVLDLNGADRTINVDTSTSGGYADLPYKVTGTGGLIKTGQGILRMNQGGAACDYSGSTQIQKGTLQVMSGDDRLPPATTVTLGSGTDSGKLIIGSSTTARSQTLAGLLTSGSGATNAVVGQASANSTLVLNIASGNNSYGGLLGGAGANENNLALTKSGAGTLTLSSSNTYSGNTTISAGTLALSGSGSIAGANMTVAKGATFDVSAITPAGYTLPAGALTNGIDKTSGVTSQGQIVIAGKNLTYAGSLTVGKTGADALASGDSFTLVSKTSGALSGWFSSVSLPALTSGISWDTNNLASSGVLDIYNFTTTALEISTPTNAAAVVSAPKLANHASSARAASPYPTGWNASASNPTNGGSVVVNGNGSLTYTPAGAANTNGGTDGFTVTFRDGHGLQTMAVSVAVGTSSTGGQSPNVLTSGIDGSGNFYALFVGATNTTYTVETNSVVSGPTWVKYANYTTGTDGLINVTNVTTGAGSLFFRTLYPSY